MWKDFQFNASLLLKNSSDTIKYGGFGDDGGSRVLNQLELMGGTKQERVTVINL